jgi:hypothetical protein
MAARGNGCTRATGREIGNPPLPIGPLQTLWNRSGEASRASPDGLSAGQRASAESSLLFTLVHEP